MLIAFTITTTLNSCVATAGVTYENYTPPAWAPPYDDVSSIQYYYFPDYDMYYDVWNNQFWCLDNGAWMASAGLPPMYANVDLYSSYMVLVNKKYRTPWNDNDYYVQNYPAHSYQSYKDIVVNNRIVKNIAPNHELVPRAYNENNNRVTFMQHPVNNTVNASVQNRQEQPPHPTPAPAPTTTVHPQYHNVVHEVPMQSIKPHMPAESQNLSYGRGFKSH